MKFSNFKVFFMKFEVMKKKTGFLPTIQWKKMLPNAPLGFNRCIQQSIQIGRKKSKMCDEIKILRWAAGCGFYLGHNIIIKLVSFHI